MYTIYITCKNDRKFYVGESIEVHDTAVKSFKRFFSRTDLHMEQLEEKAVSALLLFSFMISSELL